ncbi:DUF2147 domain-containing protein [Erythrobacter sp. T5W1-R]|uniref:DUF2147 domain-containing protein n=1 Tax=Erythrobacter sp. T5W1-R TaxID=3101752 RepID=UPI002AFEC864|nr:DUF2147 domain-containing protein [Erythrobacter sp. T5W1-R]MEA1618953.1 DUF2147 domain-containing protein [Erythrobacter sp. T5W1-R]
MMRRWLMAVLVLGAVPASAADTISGRWITQEKDAVVAIAKCGNALCGRLDKFLVLPKGGKDQRDINNADPAKRQRRLLGLTILSSLTADGDVWRGEIYDPKSGRTYTSEVRRKGPGVLEVKGCFGVLCRTQEWRKAG